MKLGVLDWGIGGIDAWRRLRAALPGHDYVYLSDAGFTPYGKVPPDQLRARVAMWSERLEVDALVVACNAASTVLDFASSIPIVGVIEPGIAMVRSLGIPTIGIMGGDRTIQSAIHERAFMNDGRRVIAIACQPLSAHVEAGRLDGEALIADLAPRLRALSEADATLLACTHYPALLPVLSRLMPTMTWLDPVEALVAACVRRWPSTGGQSSSRVFTTGSIEGMRAASEAAFGVVLEDIDRL